MSEEVKRHLVTAGSECSEMAYAADHDRIVSALTEGGRKLQAERDKWQQEAIRIAVAVCALGKMEFDQLTDDTKLIEVMLVIREAIQERDQLAERCRELEADYKIILQYEDAAIRDEAKYLAEIDTLHVEVERLQRELATAHADASHYASTAEDLRAEGERLKPLLKEAGDELKELKASVGYRANTIGVIQRIEEALEAGHG